MVILGVQVSVKSCHFRQTGRYWEDNFQKINMLFSTNIICTILYFPKGFQKMNAVSTLLEELIKSAPWEVLRPKFTLQIQFSEGKMVENFKEVLTS